MLKGVKSLSGDFLFLVLIKVEPVICGHSKDTILQVLELLWDQLIKANSMLPWLWAFLAGHPTPFIS